MELKMSLVAELEKDKISIKQEPITQSTPEERKRFNEKIIEFCKENIETDRKTVYFKNTYNNKVRHPQLKNGYYWVVYKETNTLTIGYYDNTNPKCPLWYTVGTEIPSTSKELIILEPIKNQLKTIRCR